jgi:hypothetical protein
MMFSPIEESTAHSPEHKLGTAGRREFKVFDLTGRFAAYVDYQNIGPVPDLVPRRLDAAAEVNLFAVQEKPWIE